MAYNDTTFKSLSFVDFPVPTQPTNSNKQTQANTKTESKLPLRNTQIPVSAPDAGLRLTEIFYSLQGEANATGAPTIFIRLTGCPLRCVYCDTTYSFHGGKRWALEEILKHLQQFPCKRVCVTGGEPLAQPNAIALMQLLLKHEYEISLETSGAISVEKVPTQVSKVMDVKTPCSEEESKNDWSNIAHLTKNDQVKFVIMNREDYLWSKSVVEQYQLSDKVSTIWFSPVFSIDDDVTVSNIPPLATKLAQWILDDGIEVRLQLQLHKLLWADAKGK